MSDVPVILLAGDDAEQLSDVRAYLARELADANGGTLEFAAGPPPTRFTLQCKSAAESNRA